MFMSYSIKDNFSDCKIRYHGLTRLGWFDYSAETMRLYTDVWVYVGHIHRVKNDIQVSFKMDHQFRVVNLPIAYC
jgi:hypothetical protein